MIPDETIDLIRESADIVQIIGEHVSLRRAGADWRGPCPFHQGTHRNFSVSPKKRMYYCFVCHEGGDVFNFLQRRLGMDWPAAVRLVAEKSGIEIREVESRREGPDPREPMWELNGAAAEYFQRMLWDGDAGRDARAYLEQRRITREVAERHGLGFAPREVGALRAHLNTLGFDDQRLLDGGLLVRREEGEEVRPRFRGRLMFPIHDPNGRPCGFGGRLIGPGEPKYLNSSDSSLFSKGKLLYGMHSAKHAVRRDDRIVLVEGYFDVVRLVAAGLETVVAPLGTALTEEQAALIARYTKNVFLLYDSDRAGLKATFRAGDALLAHGLTVRVATLPNGEDPDTFVDRQGVAALEGQLANAIDVFDRKVQILERGGWFADLHRRRQAIDRLLPTIRAATDPVTRDMYVARASEAAKIDRAVLLTEVDTGGALRRERSAAPAPAPAHGGAPRQGGRRHEAASPGERYRVRAAPGVAAERELVRVMLTRRQFIERIAEQRGSDEFRDATYAEIFRALLESPDVTVDELAAMLSPAATVELDRLVAEPDAVVDVDRTVEHSIGRLRERDLDERNAAIDARYREAKDDGERDALLAEKMANQRERQAIRELYRERPGQPRS